MFTFIIFWPLTRLWLGQWHTVPYLLVLTTRNSRELRSIDHCKLGRRRQQVGESVAHIRRQSIWKLNVELDDEVSPSGGLFRVRKALSGYPSHRSRMYYRISSPQLNRSAAECWNVHRAANQRLNVTLSTLLLLLFIFTFLIFALGSKDPEG